MCMVTHYFYTNILSMGNNNQITCWLVKSTGCHVLYEQIACINIESLSRCIPYTTGSTDLVLRHCVHILNINISSSRNLTYNYRVRLVTFLLYYNDFLTKSKKKYIFIFNKKRIRNLFHQYSGYQCSY